MKAVFADTWFYIAFLDARDLNHERVVCFARENAPKVITTRWILAELANALSRRPIRSRAAAFLRAIESDTATRIISESDELFERGERLYEQRPDKDWSLTDCISFVVMEREEIREALTNDHHFAQAGFVATFADPD